MFCANCEQEVPPDSRFCNHCGLGLEKTPEASSSAEDSPEVVFLGRRIASTGTAGSASLGEGIFVGRQREMGEPKAALEDAWSTAGGW
jgi:hypothetical protein